MWQALNPGGDKELLFEGDSRSWSQCFFATEVFAYHGVTVSIEVLPHDARA